MSWLFLMWIGCGGAQVEVTEAQEPAAQPETPETAEEAPAAERRVFFVSPQDGATVKSPVTIQMGVEGMGIEPAGELVDGTGHHHVIIGPAGIAQGEVVPADDKHIHFGQGQTEATVELEPGEHRITLQFADGMHVSFGDEMAATITITVEE